MKTVGEVAEPHSYDDLARASTSTHEREAPGLAKYLHDAIVSNADAADTVVSR